MGWVLVAAGCVCISISIGYRYYYFLSIMVQKEALRHGVGCMNPLGGPYSSTLSPTTRSTVPAFQPGQESLVGGHWGTDAWSTHLVTSEIALVEFGILLNLNHLLVDLHIKVSR